MSKFFLFSKFNTKKVPSDKNKWYQQLSINFLGLNLLSALLIIVLFISYIALVNDTANDGFAYDGLQKKLVELENNNKKLELSVHNLQSMSHIKTMSENYSFEPVDEVSYLNGQPAVAFHE